MRTDVLGIGFDNLTMEEAVNKGLEFAEKGSSIVVTPNPEIVYISRKDRQLQDILNSADMVLADGVGITYGAKILGKPLKGRVPGIDFAAGLMAKMADKGLNLFLFGSKPGVADKAADNLKKDYPKLNICGTLNGYFENSEPIIEKINASEADVVFVCLGAPKQEKWMAEHRKELNAHLLVGLGGSLDVFAGTVQRAPERWRKLKLEWLYRLIKQPSRIGRMARLPMFIFAVVGQRLKGK